MSSLSTASDVGAGSEHLPWGSSLPVAAEALICAGRRQREEGGAQAWIRPRWVVAGALLAEALRFLPTRGVRERESALPWKAGLRPSPGHSGQPRLGLWDAGPDHPPRGTFPWTPSFPSKDVSIRGGSTEGSPQGQEGREAGDRGPASGSGPSRSQPTRRATKPRCARAPGRSTNKGSHGSLALRRQGGRLGPALGSPKASPMPSMKAG